jgi:hypothetical protein
MKTAYTNAGRSTSIRPKATRPKSYLKSLYKGESGQQTLTQGVRHLARHQNHRRNPTFDGEDDPDASSSGDE